MCVAPAIPAGKLEHGDGSAVGKGVDIAVTNNLVDFATNRELSFKYDPLALIYSVLPRAGPLSGGTAIRVIGTNFVDRPDGLLCRFGDVVTMATYVSSEQIRCESPKQRYSVATEVSRLTSGGTGYVR